MMPNVVLIGMPGSGKTAVGRKVAETLGWSLLDTDEMIARRTGRSVADLFAEGGEVDFREAERVVVREAAKTRRAVIATGGGVVLDARNMAALRRHGFIVSLAAAPEVLLARMGADGGGRPLLAPDAPARVQTLLAERALRYDDADVVLDAARPIEQLADDVLAAVAAQAGDTVTVDLSERTYPVRIGAGILDLLGWEIRRTLPAAQAVILTHPRLWRRFGVRVEPALAAAGLSALVVSVPEGEGSKSLRRASAVFDRMATAGIDRTAVVIGLGGGVIGDLAGYVAGTYMRGLALVHLPTTLLAQVDSAIGGKAAVNHPRAKNLIGVFHQPAMVMADVETLKALPMREVHSGLAEVIKYGMVCDAELLAYVEERMDALLRREVDALRKCVRWCASIKARIVHEDERERGPRRLLNYGHTVGHALEILAGGSLTHGEAIAVGMNVEARIAGRLGLAAEEVVRRQEALLRHAGLPTAIPRDGPGVDETLGAMRLDKKVRHGELRLTLVGDPGKGVIDEPVPDAVVKEVLVACRASS